MAIDTNTDEAGTQSTTSKAATTDDVDPRDTEHPTGAAQAAENAANDPPG